MMQEFDKKKTDRRQNLIFISQLLNLANRIGKMHIVVNAQFIVKM